MGEKTNADYMDRNIKNRVLFFISNLTQTDAKRER